MTRPALRSVGTPHVKELINQRHILSRNVSDLLTSAPLWLWLECLDHPPQLGFGWRALRDIRKRMWGGTQHMWCCLDIAKHIRLARTHFFTLSRLSMVADWGRIFGIRGGELPTKPTYWTYVYKPTVLLPRLNTQLAAEHMPLPCHWCGAFRVRFRVKSADWG